MDYAKLAQGDGSRCHATVDALASCFGQHNLHTWIVDVVIDGTSCITTSTHTGH